MPRPKKSRIRHYFVYDLETNKSICQCPINNKIDDNAAEKQINASTSTTRNKKSDINIRNVPQRLSQRPERTENNNENGKVCHFRMTGNKASNLRKHVEKLHPSTYIKFLEEETNNQIQVTVSQKRKFFSNSGFTGAENQGKLMKYSPTRNVITTTVSIKPEDVLLGIIEMVTINDRSFTLMDDSGFTRAFGPVLKACNITLNSHNIIKHIQDRSFYIQNKIKELVKNRLVCIKTDYVTCLGRCFIGINIQFIHDEKLKVFTLRTSELTIRLTGENLKRIILSELEKYCIKPENIYTVTTDVLKTVRLMPYESDQFFSDDEALNNPEICENQELVDIIQDQNWKQIYIASIRCAAHTLQLCISDTLKNTFKEETTESYVDVIKRARLVVRELRTQNNMILLKQNKLCKPVLDCPTRWSSTYVMLEILLKLKSYCECWSVNNVKLLMSEEEWGKVAEIVQCLLPSKKATTKLQTEDITLTDIYKIWDLCHIQTAELGLPFSQALVNNFNKRRHSIFENEVFLSAMYLDPRFSFELTDNQRETAIKHISGVYNKLEVLLLQESKEDDRPISSDNESLGSSIYDPDELRYERILLQKHKNRMLHSRLKAPEFETICRTFNPPRLKSTENILDFWRKNHAIYPDLFSVAEVVFSVPGTQVSVERLFSQLKFILDSLTNSLSSDIINAILLVKSNFKHLT